MRGWKLEVGGWTATLFVPLVAVALIFVACGGDDDDAVLTPDAEVTAAATDVANTPDVGATAQSAQPTPAPGGEVEVQGIVGAIDENGRTIEINRLQGADVSVIEVGSATRITGARGSALELGDLRPSDRIVARGTVEDGALAATEIEVGQAVPGAAPGG